jgi:hypothetical protein
VGVLQGVKSNGLHLDISQLKNPSDVSSSFVIGNHVQVSRRKQPGVNEEGGVAEITEVYLRRGQVRYTVRYVLDNREENDLDDSIMQLWVPPAGRPTRSTQSAQQGFLFSLIP